MKGYTLFVSDELWRRFKSKCALLGLKVKDAITQAITKWVDEEERRERNEMDC